MTAYDVAFVGTGPEPDNPVWGVSAAMAYRHAAGYAALDACDLVACADLVPENAAAFAAEFDVPDARVYEDYETMLAEADPDVVSVATPVPTHAPIVLDLIDSGVPDAVHCEKPMATTWGDARRMAAAADEAGVQLTFNHQRRLSSPWRDAKALLDEGTIGDLQRVELACGELLDSGTHLLDLANYYAGERGAEWVIGQVDYREEHVKYGAHNENQALALWAYDDGTFGLAVTGVGTGTVPAAMRLVGADGVVELSPTWADDPPLRVWRTGDAGWETVPVEDTGDSVPLAIEHVIDCLASGEEPLLSARRALNATEIIFGTYESARRRGRVEFPLRIEDNPLEAMVASGDLDPAPADDA